MPRIEATVCVLGAGATGLALAFKLRLAGITCVVIDRDTPGSGATCNSGGVLHSGARYAVSDPDLARLCAKAHATLLQHAPFAVINRTPAYYVARDAEEEAYADRLFAACRSLGIEAERLSKREVNIHEPRLRETVCSAVAVPDFVIDPFLLVAAYLGALRDTGGVVLSNVEVNEAVRSDRGWSLQGRAGSTGEHVQIESDLLVLALGAWTPLFLSRLGVNLQPRYARGSILAVEAQPVRRIISRSHFPSTGDSVIPCYETTLLGSTWTAQETPEPMPTSAEDIRQVVEVASSLVKLGKPASIRAYSGVRVMLASSPDAEREVDRRLSRGYHLLDHGEAHGLDGLYSIFGGKLTLHDAMATDTARRVGPYLGRPIPTGLSPLARPASAPSFHLGSLRANTGRVSPDFGLSILP